MATLLKEKIPAHVPEDRVVDADVFNLPGSKEDAHSAWLTLRGEHDLVWTPHYGGHWIATGAPVMDSIYRRLDEFSNSEIGIPPGSMLIPLLPIQKDGAEHKEFRDIIEPAFKPSALDSYNKLARSLTIDLIEGFRPRGSCEFISEYALILPLTIFLQMVDLPQEDREELHHYAEIMTRTSDMEKRHAAFHGVINYLERWIEKRRREPGQDLLSSVVHSKPFGRPATHDEVLGMGALLLFGGLDTVTSMMGFVMRFLATHPGHRRWLIEHPQRMAAAIEEIMRRHGVANNTRTATRDVELDGVTIRKGEHVLIPTMLYSLDPRAFDNPMEVDFERSPKWSATFGTGPHRCPGMNLARLEMRVLVEEWLKRIPDFEIDPTQPVIQGTGGVSGVLQLPLSWPVPAE